MKRFSVLLRFPILPLPWTRICRSNARQGIRANLKLAAYKGPIYGEPATPHARVPHRKEDFSRKAGRDPEKDTSTMPEVFEDANKIRSLGPDIYEYSIAGNRGECNIS